VVAEHREKNPRHGNGMSSIPSLNLKTRRISKKICSLYFLPNVQQLDEDFHEDLSSGMIR
jgi:hypothetical protein